MGRVRQVSLDPRRTKRVFECLYYHGKDLCMGCREMVCSTLSHLRGHRNMPWERRSADTTYGSELVPYEVIGVPKDLASAAVLAQEDRYQFEWWALGLVD